MTLSTLPQLHSFPDIQVPEPERFGDALSDPRVIQVVCYCTDKTAEGAEIYADVAGIRNKLQIEVLGDASEPCQAVSDHHTPGTVPIFLDPVNSGTKDRYFTNPQLITFADNNIVRPREHHVSPDLQTVGTTGEALQGLVEYGSGRTIAELQQERSDALHRVLGEDMITSMDMRRILESDQISNVVIHALGPDGTNISQVARQYVSLHGLRHKSDIRVHSAGVEPREYAKIARAETKAGEIHLHIRCAVYYQERVLYDERADEHVFADVHPMPLDTMQVASKVRDPNELLNGRPLVLASHPSPIGLVQPWLDSGHAEHMKVASNSVAASMVRSGEADICMTTESARINNGLIQNHSSGSPLMMFTLGTPTSPDTLREYRSNL